MKEIIDVKSFVTQYVEIIHELLWKSSEYITTTDVYLAYYERYENYLKSFNISDSLVRSQGSREKVIANEVKDQTGSKSLEKAKAELRKCLKNHGKDFIEEKDGTNKRYRYPDSLSFNPLDEYQQSMKRQRKKKLDKIYSLLRSSKDLFPASWIDTMGLQLYRQEDTDNKHNILHFAPTQLTGIELVPQLYEHILARKVVSFKYHPFGKVPYTTVVSPYRLLEYNMRWFLLCMSLDRQGGQHFTVCAIDRILPPILPKENLPYVEPPFDVDAFYNDVIGTTRPPDAQPENVVLLIEDERTLGYISSKPLHHSQQVEGNKVTLHVVLNYELEARLMEFADRIRIEAPDILRLKLRERAKKILIQTEE